MHAPLADRDAAARAWKTSGGAVIGYLGATVPVELIDAAGAFALQLSGAGIGETPHADRYMEPLFDPVVRRVFEKLLSGAYGFLDAVILPRTSDSAQRLYYYLCEVRRMGWADVPEPLLWDLLQTPWYSSAEYGFRRLGELREAVGRVAGQAITDAALGAAIVGRNAWRATLSRAADARREGRMAGSDAHALALASRVLPPEALAAEVDQALRAAAAGGSGPRLVVAGSAPDGVDVHRLLESLGGQVVGDYHEAGEPGFGPMVQGRDPMRALLQHYQREVMSSRRFPFDPQAVVACAKAARADAVVFAFHAEEEALTWELPAQRRALSAAGIASVSFEGQGYPLGAEALRQPLAQFLSELKVTA